MKGIKIKVEVDTGELDRAIEKANQLLKILENAQKINKITRLMKKPEMIQIHIERPDTLCAFSGKALCESCKGPVYLCDPEKNIECSHENCKSCFFTKDKRFSYNGTPICARSKTVRSL